MALFADRIKDFGAELHFLVLWTSSSYFLQSLLLSEPLHAHDLWSCSKYLKPLKPLAAHKCWAQGSPNSGFPTVATLLTFYWELKRGDPIVCLAFSLTDLGHLVFLPHIVA